MEILRVLPEAMPILARHLRAYAELVQFDLARAQRELTRRLWGSLLTAVSLVFACAMLCLGILAKTWDTPYRLIAIEWMGGVFLLLALLGTLLRSRTAAANGSIFAAVQSEWRQDCLALERILADDSKRT